MNRRLKVLQLVHFRLNAPEKFSKWLKIIEYEEYSENIPNMKSDVPTFNKMLKKKRNSKAQKLRK